jgi:hydrogenase expression/formation protein HypC
MCLAVPMRIVEADGPRGVVESSGVRYEIRLDLVGDVRIGEFVLVHAGYAIQVMDEAAAAEQLALLEPLLSEPGNALPPPETRA